MAQSVPAAPDGDQPARGDAIAIYERALRSLQQHRYAEAADLLRRVIAGFPDERELLDRSRVYLSLCDRHLNHLKVEPANAAERLYAATLALNAGAPERAIAYLERIADDEPARDQALYLMAIAHAERGDAGVAIRYLQQAIEANPENRSLARVDPDLEALRRETSFAALLGGTPAFQASEKRAARR